MADLSKLPSVDLLARTELLASYPQPYRLIAARVVIDRCRQELVGGPPSCPLEIEKLAAIECQRLAGPTLRPAINLSGVVLHTGIGRARLAPSVALHIANVARSHASLEIDIETGDRGDRQTHIAWMLRELTGAEDALVVNNCAGAVLLALSILCAGREVVLSRGQMVEIGGAFRLPDIVRQSGCTLVEVGCTNKTHLSDYAEAITPSSAAILRCHPSNFKIVGFTDEPAASELAKLAHQGDVLLIDDVGSGCLIDTACFGLPREPTLRDSLVAGADLVLASGDKLLGGPQAGILLGRTALIHAIRRHPLARALRIDKLSMAGLEATLRLYIEGRHEEIPVWTAIARPLDSVKRAAQTLRRASTGAWIEPGESEIGAGAFPGATIPTWRVGLRSNDPIKLLASMRRHEWPIIARIERDTVWLDPRTLAPDETPRVLQFLRSWRDG